MNTRHRAKTFYEKNKNDFKKYAINTLIGLAIISIGKAGVVKGITRNIVEKALIESPEFVELKKIVEETIYLTKQNSEQITIILESDRMNYERNEERWNNQRNFNGVVDGKLGLSEVKTSHFRGIKVDKDGNIID